MKTEPSTFYLVIPPGFEQEATRELETKASLEHTDFHLDLNLPQGLALNHQLRIPTRILLRLAVFKARDFPKLHNKIANMAWRLWLWSDSVDFHVSTSQSRLIHTGRIEEVAQEAIQKSLKAQPFKKHHLNYFNFKPQVYIRVQDDEVTISIDTSYPPLYKRGFDKSSHHASLRENLAYACWLKLQSYISEGLDSFNLIDPMCGSGSFLTEALELSQRENFAYQGFPCSKLEKIEVKSINSNPIFKCHGLDHNDEYIEANKTLFPEMHWEQRDLFITEAHQSSKENILITNPPYNKRIKIDQNMKQILDAMIESYNPLLIGLIVPKDKISQLKPKKYELAGFVNFRNGGLPCQFMVFKRN